MRVYEHLGLLCGNKIVGTSWCTLAQNECFQTHVFSIISYYTKRTSNYTKLGIIKPRTRQYLVIVTRENVQIH